MGARALFTQAYSNTDTAWDSHNTAVGYEALYANQPTATNNGVYNTAIGSGAMRSNTTGVRNTAMGYQSLYYNETGYYNTAIGYAALYSNTTGHENTALGLWAGDSWQTGYYNTFVGNSADAGVEGLFNATAIGYGAIVTASNMVRLGNDAVTLIQGAVNFTTPSDIRLKKDVEDIGQGLDFVKALRPVQYRLKSGNERIDFGFIAQDIEALIGTDYNVLGIGADADRTLSLRYTDFIAPMVKAIQEQQGIIEQLKAEVAELKRMLGK
jgi:trimeric autotransporter adhesin